ncbi:MAG TPA: hypothetical protein VHU83_14110 [Bryobacteraceae bacterium]|jgi:hypothetical protein|nr:hypothetical protein [Bryobacteraceae bacterium]
MPRAQTDDGAYVRTGTAQERTATLGAPILRGKYGVAAVLGWWALLFGASLLLYWPGLRAGYFSDDLLFFFNAPPPHLFDYFATRGAAAQAYRPLEAIILTFIQQNFRFETLPIHLLSLGAHAGLCCAVLAAGRRLSLKTFENWTAGIFMLVAQVGAPAVLGNDTLSQSASAFFGGLSALFLYFVWLERAEERVWPVSKLRWLIASVAAYTISLFFKETALGFLLVAVLLAGLIGLEERTWAARLQTAVKLLLPYGAATLVYGVARLGAGGAISQSGSYQIHLGVNIVRNLAEFGLAAFGPMSTVDGAVAIAMHRTPELILGALGWLFVITVMVVGICVSRRRTAAVWLLIAAIASLFPAYLLTHVSELYLYNAIPFLALALAIALGGLWDRGAPARLAAVACAGLLISGQIYADRQKAELMAQNGRRAGVIYAGIDRYLPALPPDSQILLVNPPNRIPEYSVFLLKGFDVVDLGNLHIGPIFGRPDVRVELIDESRARNVERRKNRLLLALDASGGVKPYE